MQEPGQASPPSWQAKGGVKGRACSQPLESGTPATAAPQLSGETAEAEAELAEPAWDWQTAVSSLNVFSSPEVWERRLRAQPLVLKPTATPTRPLSTGLLPGSPG